MAGIPELLLVGRVNQGNWILTQQLFRFVSGEEPKGRICVYNHLVAQYYDTGRKIFSHLFVLDINFLGCLLGEFEFIDINDRAAHEVVRDPAPGKVNPDWYVIPGQKNGLDILRFLTGIKGFED